jgi:hypothetical protein
VASVARQRPPAQTTVDGAAMAQASPHPPQLLASAVRSVHAPAQQTLEPPHDMPSGWPWTPQKPPLHVATMQGEPVDGHVDGSEQGTPPELATVLLDELATVLLDVLDVTPPPVDAVLDAAPPVAALDAVDVAAPPVAALDAALAGLPLVEDAPAPDAAGACPPPLPLEAPVTSYAGRAHAAASPTQARKEGTSRDAERMGMALRGGAWRRHPAAASMTTPPSAPVKVCGADAPRYGA